MAEVFITLDIIGVVAAMTMPTLINQTNGAQYKVAYKKALSAISQAVTLNVALDDWSFADLKTDAENADNSTTVEKILRERMNVVSDNENTNMTNYTSDITVDSNNTTLFFNDGIMFTFNDTASQECTKPDSQTVEAFVKKTKLVTNV